MKAAHKFLVLMLACAVGQAQDTASPLEFQLKFNDRLVEAVKPFEERRKQLMEGYVKKVSERQAKFQSSGDLQKALRAKAEIDHMKKNGTLGEEFPRVDTSFLRSRILAGKRSA